MSLSEAAFGGTGHTQPAFPALRVDAGVGLARGGLFARAEHALDAERGRWFLWLPVFFGCGIAFYLGAPVEPPLLLATGAALSAMALRIFFRATAFRLILGSILLTVALGFLTAKLHALFMDAPALTRELRFAQLDGWVEAVDRQEKRVRLTIRVIAIAKLAPDMLPRRVRISQSAKGPAPSPGDAIRVRATLMPPPNRPRPAASISAAITGSWGWGRAAMSPARSRPCPVRRRCRSICASMRRSANSARRSRLASARCWTGMPAPSPRR